MHKLTATLEYLRLQCPLANRNSDRPPGSSTFVQHLLSSGPGLFSPAQAPVTSASTDNLRAVIASLPSQYIPESQLHAPLQHQENDHFHQHHVLLHSHLPQQLSGEGNPAGYDTLDHMHASSLGSLDRLRTFNRLGKLELAKFGPLESGETTPPLPSSGMNRFSPTCFSVASHSTNPIHENIEYEVSQR
ncbi:unnamed protein product [Protopolystoma xenopodis]|uniref:Uncharacterized protein n=1 Tax=Protopolystoma xenopodis TaxID=117903 RepID=A0A3S4ZHM6_9PLAT|nr:unnamed protein product [Protopolystoma xenopodis]